MYLGPEITSKGARDKIILVINTVYQNKLLNTNKNHGICRFLEISSKVLGATPKGRILFDDIFGSTNILTENMLIIEKKAKKAHSITLKLFNSR